MDDMAWMAVAKESEISAGQMKTVLVQGKEIVIYNVDGKLYATSSTCLHEEGPLGFGTLEKNTVTCPLHGWRYDVTNGRHLGPEPGVLETFQVKAENGEILLETKG